MGPAPTGQPKPRLREALCSPEACSGPQERLIPAQASVSVQSVSPNSPATDTKLDWKAQKEEQARLRKRQNDLKKVEAEIHDLETRDGEIDALLCDESVFTDVARLMELNKEKEDLGSKAGGPL